MGKASSTKKVARAASTGGGRTAGKAKPWMWYIVMGLVTVLGVAGIVFSREQRRDELASGSGTVAPVVGDHWHAAYGVYLCNEFAPTIQDQRDPQGIHNHGDGIIHIHPFTRASAGNNATIGRYADAVKMTLTDEEIKVPGGKSFSEGKTKCDGKPGIVQVKVNDQVITDNVADIKLPERGLITIAFAPEGAELPPPPSAGNLDRLSDVDQPPSTLLPEGSDGPPPGGKAPEGSGEVPSTDTTAPAGTPPPGTETTETTRSGGSPTSTTVPGRTTAR